MFCLSLHRFASHRMYLFSIQPSSQHFGSHPACVADGIPFLSSTVFLRGFHPCALSGLSFWPPKKCSSYVSKSAPKQLSTPCFPAVLYRMSVIVTRCSLLHQHRLLCIHSLFTQPQAPLKGLLVVTERWGQCIVAKLLSGTQGSAFQMGDIGIVEPLTIIFILQNFKPQANFALYYSLKSTFLS